MGRTVVYDDHIQKSINNLLKGNGLCTGVLIGQSTVQRDIIIHLAKTPQKEEEDEEKTAGKGDKKKPKSALAAAGSPDDFDENWVCQHAKQVTRMLPGGIDILGIFAIAPTEVLNAFQHKLRQALFAVYKSLSKDLKLSVNSDISDKILLQICSVSRKVTCRTFEVEDNKSSAKPADWKHVTGSSRWHRLETSFSTNLWIPISEEQCQQGLLKQIQSSLQPLFSNIMESTTLINGEMRNFDELLELNFDKRKSRGKESDAQTVFTVDLFLPVNLNNNYNQSMEDIIPVSCGAVMTIKGTIQCRAFVNNKGTVREALKAIKQDIIRSITSRCEIQCEDMLLIEDEQHDPSVVHELPRRVFTDYGTHDVSYCDYIFHGDEASDSLEAFQELLGLEVSTDNIEMDCEHSPGSNQQIIEGAETAEIITEATEQLSKGRNILIPVASAAVAAIAAGVSYLLLQDS